MHRRVAFSVALFLLASTQVTAQRPVHTYSIVTRDPATGQMGVAVQSHWFSVGSLVNLGRVDDSLPLFQDVFSADDNWAVLLPRLVDVDMLEADSETLERILALKNDR